MTELIKQIYYDYVKDDSEQYFFVSDERMI